jgi:hypothetical protein
MMLRLMLISSAISGVLQASDSASTLSPFPDAGKSLQQLARESVDRRVAASVRGKRGAEPASPLAFGTRLHVKLPQRTRAETCSIPLLESKVQHPERFRMQVLKVPAKQVDNIATPAPAPICEGWNSR